MGSCKFSMSPFNGMYPCMHEYLCTFRDVPLHKGAMHHREGGREVLFFHLHIRSISCGTRDLLCCALKVRYSSSDDTKEWNSINASKPRDTWKRGLFSFPWIFLFATVLGGKGCFICMTRRCVCCASCKVYLFVHWLSNISCDAF